MSCSISNFYLVEEDNNKIITYNSKYEEDRVEFPCNMGIIGQVIEK